MGELKARMEHAPPSVKSVAPEIPSAVDAIVSRCLEKTRETRFQSARDLAFGLDVLSDASASASPSAVEAVSRSLPWDSSPR